MEKLRMIESFDTIDYCESSGLRRPEGGSLHRREQWGIVIQGDGAAVSLFKEQSASCPTGANPLRKVFSVTLIGIRKCLR